jgi:hypothetical protein
MCSFRYILNFKKNIACLFDIRLGINLFSIEVLILSNLLLKKVKNLSAVIHAENPKPMGAIYFKLNEMNCLKSNFLQTILSRIFLTLNNLNHELKTL